MSDKCEGSRRSLNDVEEATSSAIVVGSRLYSYEIQCKIHYIQIQYSRMWISNDIHNCSLMRD